MKNVIKATLTILILSITLLSTNTVSNASQNNKELNVEDTSKEKKQIRKKHKLIYSAEGIGIVVDKPAYLKENDYKNIKGAKKKDSIINNNYVNVSGGTLWTSWKNGKVFRANYDHSKKTHRCSASNDHMTIVRSSWVSKGITARSPWLDQTVSNNRTFAKTK